MITISFRSHLDHMDLKNWALSLFDIGRPLHTCGFKSCRVTPSIVGETKSWTPDLIAWSNRMVLIIECKAGDPSDDDVTQAKDYATVPESLLMKLTGLSHFNRKVALLYFKERLESKPELKEQLLGKLSLEKDLVVWVCERGFSMGMVCGSHDDNELDSFLKGGLNLSHLPNQQIEIQPDSPVILLEKLLFTRLWERAFRFRDTRFTIGTAREILANHNYALKNRQEKKLQDAIKSAERHGLCLIEETGKVWKLNLIPESSASVELYLKKLSEILKYPELPNFTR